MSEMTNRTSDRKIVANRSNSKKSSGPKNTIRTRLNALKHGLLADALTELDDRENYGRLHATLEEDYVPRTRLECYLVERIAFCIVRLDRACKLESEYIAEVEAASTFTYVHGCPSGRGDLVPTDSDKPPRLPVFVMPGLIDLYQRYETAVESKLYRAIAQLQKLRCERHPHQEQRET